jgi:spermidine/putrescine-binding protein
MFNMTAPWTPEQSRRDFLKLTAAAGAAGTGLLSLPAGAQGAPLNYFTWSAAVDLVKSHLTAFEAKTGIKVNYSNAPWAQYRDTMVTKFVGKAPIDALWVSDSWLPGWADAGWIAPINGYPELMKYNAGVDDFCNQSMQYKGKQYGLTYYSDYMAFFYDEEMLKKAGIKSPLFGVPGNHDYWSGISFAPVHKCFESTGGAWLLDERRKIAGGKINLIGVTCNHGNQALLPLEPAMKNILLVHYPAWVKKLGGQKFDLMLAGHSHGGQVRIPFYGSLVVPFNVDEYDMGLFQTPSGPLYVNPGIGYISTYKIRFNCRPEITVIEI